MSAGHPVPNSTCDNIVPGRSGLTQGTLATPGYTDIFWDLQGPMRCATAIVPMDSQSLTLRVNRAFYAT